MAIFQVSQMGLTHSLFILAWGVDVGLVRTYGHRAVVRRQGHAEGHSVHTVEQVQPEQSNLLIMLNI
jgi:hypothetical protein